MDAYGPRIPIAWSGKDFFKADRAGGIHARRLANAIVQFGLASEAQVVLGCFPGDRSARLLSVTSSGGRTLEVNRLVEHFDLSLNRSGTAFPVDQLIDVARWGTSQIQASPGSDSIHHECQEYNSEGNLLGKLRG